MHSTDRCLVSILKPGRSTYTYLVPRQLKYDIRPGIRVLVPVGRSIRPGIVVQQYENPSSAPGTNSASVSQYTDQHNAAITTRQEPDPSTLREISACDTDLGLVVYPDQLALASFIHQYYVSSLGEALKLMVPPGLLSQRGKSQVWSKTEEVIHLTSDLPERLRGAKQLAIVEYLAQHGGSVAWPTLSEATGVRRDALNRLIARKLVQRQTCPVDRPKPKKFVPKPKAVRPNLNAKQASATATLKQHIDSNQYGAYLLYGVTGSGKTEVYLQTIEHALRAGKRAIMLVPEIALTPQTVARFTARFGDQVAVLHSQQSDRERFETWDALRHGQYQIVIGPRSAIFSPMPDLGIILVDEEHEASYKQFDPAPRYHAREIALVRAQQAGAVCLLGSATPSTASWHAVKTGKLSLLDLPERVPLPSGATAQMPSIRVVDLRNHHHEQEFKESGISTPLLSAIRERIDKQQQVVLLLNRRGYAPVLQCTHCGAAPTCPNCSVSMTVHQGRYGLQCHYCGRLEQFPTHCPECHSPSLVPLGRGTQRVEEHLNMLIPEARILRMDFDTTRGALGHATVLSRFGNHEADILLGTQMIAKGLDYPNVTLVGVLSADQSLSLPDYRAEERTHALLTQVSGRAGRSTLPGEVIIQAYQVDHRTLAYVRRSDVSNFLDVMLEERALLKYPPYGRTASATVRGPDEQRVIGHAKHVYEWIEPRIPSSRGACSPVSPRFVLRVMKQFRYEIFIRVDRSFNLQALLHDLQEQVRPPAQTRVAIDIDPLSF